MKKGKNKPYEALDRRLKAYAEHSVNAIPIDDIAKKRIWNNLNSEIYEHAMKKQYRSRRTYRLAFIVSIVLVLIVTLDINSKASLFRRLLTSVSEGRIEFNSRDLENNVNGTTENSVHLNERLNSIKELKNEIESINEQGEMRFLSPSLFGTYEVASIDNVGNFLTINLTNEDNLTIAISQQFIVDRSASSIIDYGEDEFDKKVVNDNGQEYIIFHNDGIAIGVTQLDEVMIEVIGPNYNDVYNVILSLE